MVDIQKDDGSLYEQNLRLSKAEYELQHLHLCSRPRCLGLVLSNRCNIGCIHCYQSKNGDSLLGPPEIGRALRREFMALYPYLSTLRLQGGELFAIPGFRELLDDVGLTTSRPIVSISTNGTLIDDDWAERIVRTPFQTVTFSIDAGTGPTFARLRRGANLDTVLATVRRVVRWKEKLGSDYPCLDSFFVVMRSNYREIPQYIELMKDCGIPALALQTVQINHENLSRFPSLADDEVISSPEEIRELHALLREIFMRERGHFEMIRSSGLTTLFDEQGLDSKFLNEESNGLYPNSDDLIADRGFELCPNPWTTLFVIENGDVHLCFLSESVGNLYEASLAEIWNSPRAVAKRGDMAAGRYLASGCSRQWCAWREGKVSHAGETKDAQATLAELITFPERPAEEHAVPRELGAVRRLVASRDRRVAELEAVTQEMLRRAQTHIDNLEAENLQVIERAQNERRDYDKSTAELLQRAQAHIDQLEAKTEQAVLNFDKAFNELREYQESRLIRIVYRMSSLARRAMHFLRRRRR